MARMIRRACGWAVVLAWGVLSLSACDALGYEGDKGPADSGDAGAGAEADAGEFPDRNVDGLSPVPPSNGGVDYCAALDVNVDGLVTCMGDEFCAESGACCVNAGDCCEADGTTEVFDFAACDGTLEACKPGAFTSFGDPAPGVDGAFLPGGDASFDSGAVVNTDADIVTRKLTLTVTFTPATCPNNDCLEAAGVAVTAQGDLGDTTLVRPGVGLLWSAALGNVTLYIENSAVAEWKIADVNSTTWTLALAPSGQVFVSTPDNPAVGYEDVYAPFTDARVVLYGRNGAEPTAGITKLAVDRAVCDVPSVWESRGALPVVDGDGDTEWTNVHGPTSATHQGLTVAAFERDGAIYFGEGTMDNVVLASRTNSPALAAAGDGYMAVAVRDPEVVWDTASGAWVLFFTAEDAEGRRTVGFATTADGGATFVPAAEPRIAAANLGADAAVDVDAPSALALYDNSLVLAVRVNTEEGTYLDLWYGDNVQDATLTRTPAAALRTLTFRSVTGGVPALGTFDRDEVAAPSIHLQNRAYHVYYGGRRGTRWGIGLLVSDDLAAWRWADNGGPVLAGDGAGFDGFGVADPDVSFGAGQVRLLYMGLDGNRRVLGAASRRAPEAAVSAR